MIKLASKIAIKIAIKITKSSENKLITLHKTYQFKKFKPQCPKHYQEKLMSMGFIPGQKLYTICQAPLGGPIQIKINQTKLALRKSEISMLELAVI